MCPLFRSSTVHKEEDNLSIVDQMAGPNVSFIQRFHCTYVILIQLTPQRSPPKPARIITAARMARKMTHQGTASLLISTGPTAGITRTVAYNEEGKDDIYDIAHSKITRYS